MQQFGMVMPKKPRKEGSPGAAAAAVAAVRGPSGCRSIFRTFFNFDKIHLEYEKRLFVFNVSPTIFVMEFISRATPHDSCFGEIFPTVLAILRQPVRVRGPKIPPCLLGTLIVGQIADARSRHYL